jgi:hypothetical protein
MTGILQLELLEELVERDIGALGPVRGEGVESLVRHLQRQRLVPLQCVVNLQTMAILVSASGSVLMLALLEPDPHWQ